MAGFLPELSPGLWEPLAPALEPGLNNAFKLHEELKTVEGSGCWGRLLGKLVSQRVEL